MGCRCGFGGLDELAHRPEAAVAELSSGTYPDDFGDEDIEQLRLIESTFALEPWPNVRLRLAELRLRYAGLIEFSDDHMRFEPEPEVDGIEAPRSGGLRKFGSEGRDALTPLLSHAREDVRCAAAAYLLRHRHERARRVLEELVRGEGLAALEAQFLLKTWDEGTWALDPE